jgi:undecaprenol kinase
MPKFDSITSADRVIDSEVAGSSDWLELEQILKQDKRTGLFGLVRSFSHAFNGVKETFLSERNFKIQLVCASLVLSIAAWLKVSLLIWLILIQVIALVLVAEMVNTALEHLVDLAAGTLYHPLARAAKDTAAGAVLIASIFAVVSGVFIFGPYLSPFFQNILKIL